jgi:hypothetical protein
MVRPHDSTGTALHGALVEALRERALVRAPRAS